MIFMRYVRKDESEFVLAYMKAKLPLEDFAIKPSNNPDYLMIFGDKSNLLFDQVFEEAVRIAHNFS